MMKVSPMKAIIIKPLPQTTESGEPIKQKTITIFKKIIKETPEENNKHKLDKQA